MNDMSLPTHQNAVFLPEYRSHKIVRAGQILRIEGASQFAHAAGMTELTLKVGEDQDGNTQTTRLTVSSTWMARHRPKAGGYYVIYNDGEYSSYSPAEPFESGYTRIDAPAAPAAPLDYQALVREELANLETRIDLLRAFMRDRNFGQLNPVERTRLSRQMHVMTDYALILGERIASF